MNTTQRAFVSTTTQPKTTAHTNIVSLRKGTINFYNLCKGYGSVRDSLTRHDYIIYDTLINETISAQDYVSFELISTPAGELTATAVKRIN